MSDQTLENLIEKWQFHYPWEVVSHEANCCQFFTSWLALMARSPARGRSLPSRHPPDFIHQRWPWGPTRPIYTWCELAQTEQAECGTLAAICQETCRKLDIVAYRVQTIERHRLSDTRTWQSRWHKSGLSTNWIQSDLVYHEMVALIVQGTLRIWDSTSWRRVERAELDYSGVLALRIFGPPQETLHWQGISIPTWQWTIL